ncbi:TetR family transcriptional regulator [Pseudoclavibacter sp. AY1F1]|uniref:TetR family transcriptional regulator n=1 Tax=Pseudoclavibacter sp. AY1F1 TaxID=2080583 RepID=UPI000CE89A9D|nr:TetR family transcriptional regulator [Pseudoclavibacter sp. AY1F1]PPF44804.1 TetR family transcriptional regulator [Pseudoclavibacter sp. AY1F1]
MVKSAEGSRRAPLDRHQILIAATELAAQDGLERLSMRSLAANLGVVPMALYKHVDNKEDLVDGMVDAVVANYPHPAAGLHWRDSVRERIISARAEVLARPWLRSAIESRVTRSEVVLRHMDAAAGDFLSAGVSADLTHYAMHALGNRLWGIHSEAFEPAAEPAAEPPAAVERGPESDPQQAAEMMRLMAQHYPNVTAIAMDAAKRNPAGACEPEGEFEFGVDLLLDAFVRLHESGWVSRPDGGAAQG